MRKNNQGYTLVELLVGITVGALVTLAATTVILMGLRLNRQSMDTTGKQNTARVLLTAMENLATDGSIKSVEMNYEDWQIIGEDGVIYSYDAEDKIIYTGETPGKPFMKNVLSSYLEYEDGLLTLSVETEKGIFNSTVYCRQAITASGDSGSNEENDIVVISDGQTTPTPDSEDVVGLSEKEKAGRLVFVTTLINEYNADPNNRNIGIIKKTGDNQGLYYSQWYIGEENWRQNGWNEMTPWCACYVSWAIAEVAEDYTNYDSENFRPSFAGVDSFLTYFYLKDDPATDDIKRDYWITADLWKNGESRAAEGEEQQSRKIYPGDIIFLDWVVNEERNPQHVGVVLYVDEKNKVVYTIEGNVAASCTDGGRYGTVGLRKYNLEDPRILGYGVLDWQQGDLSTSADPDNNP